MAKMMTRPDEDTELRIGATMALPDVLRGLGANPAEVLADGGFDIRLFDDPDNMISYRERGRMLAHCAAATGCQHFGLLVGQQIGLRSLGLTGLLVKHSPDVGTALRNLSRYLHHHVRGAVASLTVDAQSAMFGYLTVQANAEANDQVGDGAVAGIFNILRDLCGPHWKPSQVLFAHRRPKDVRPFQQYFHAPIIFDAEWNGVVFSAEWLNRQVAHADPEVLRLLQREIERLDKRYDDDLPGKVRRLLRAAILTGHASLNQVATLFSMHPRTLRRYLARFETSFEELLDEIRFEIARQMLNDTRMTIAEIAVALDYSDASAFTRAFRRWSGCTPARWRAQHMVEPDRTE
jgi:AraC-like DNA-binding protein